MANKTPVPVAIIIRVSTKKQETDRQLHELTSYANGRGYSIVEVCRETISGAASADDRLALQRIEQLAADGKIQKVLVHEISRIARTNSVAHKFVENLDAHGVSLYWHAQGIETLLPNGKRNPAAGIMLALLAEMARSESETLKQRIASGLAEARRKGVTLGRPHGPTGWRQSYRDRHGKLPPREMMFKNLSDSERSRIEARAQSKFLEKHRDIVRLLKSGQSVRNAAKIADKGGSTVQRVKAMLCAA
ncbi:MAG: recombinase family protein [Chthoniobacterales bacterium]